MKRILKALLSLSLALVVCVAGCTNKEPLPSPPSRGQIIKDPKTGKVLVSETIELPRVKKGK